MIERMANPHPVLQHDANELRALFDEQFGAYDIRIVMSAICGAIANHYLGSSDATFAIVMQQVVEGLAHERKRLSGKS